MNDTKQTSESNSLDSGPKKPVQSMSILEEMIFFEKNIDCPYDFFHRPYFNGDADQLDPRAFMVPDDLSDFPGFLDKAGDDWREVINKKIKDWFRKAKLNPYWKFNEKPIVDALESDHLELHMIVSVTWEPFDKNCGSIDKDPWKNPTPYNFKVEYHPCYWFKRLGGNPWKAEIKGYWLAGHPGALAVLERFYLQKNVFAGAGERSLLSHNPEKTQQLTSAAGGDIRKREKRGHSWSKLNMRVDIDNGAIELSESGGKPCRRHHADFGLTNAEFTTLCGFAITGGDLSAGKTGKARGTIRAKVSRLRKKMQAFFKEYDGDPFPNVKACFTIGRISNEQDKLISEAKRDRDEFIEPDRAVLAYKASLGAPRTITSKRKST